LSGGHLGNIQFGGWFWGVWRVYGKP